MGPRCSLVFVLLLCLCRPAFLGGGRRWVRADGEGPWVSLESGNLRGIEISDRLILLQLMPWHHAIHACWSAEEL
ncbi:hypothetical protein GQ53DRAFT_744876 [Thozetella sp. PMI_491]|nr:hypothetical protein GQ53DRAFT_744876 [Thozetella sp. PMI_491]